MLDICAQMQELTKIDLTHFSHLKYHTSEQVLCNREQKNQRKLHLMFAFPSKPLLVISHSWTCPYPMHIKQYYLLVILTKATVLLRHVCMEHVRGLTFACLCFLCCKECCRSDWWLTVLCAADDHRRRHLRHGSD